MTDESRIRAARLLAASPYAMPAEDALAHIRARRKNLLAAPPLPEPDFSPEPFPFLDAPQEFARDFLAKKRGDRGAKPASPPAKAGKPQRQKARPFTVIRGGRHGDNDRDG